MNNIADYLEEKLLDHVLRNSVYSSPTTVYVGLVDSTGTDAEMEGGTLTNEITTYTGDRKAVTFTAPAQVADKATVENSADIDFLDMPAITVTYAIVCDAATAGNVLYWCPLTSSKTTNAGDTFRIPAGDLTLDLD